MTPTSKRSIALGAAGLLAAVLVTAAGTGRAESRPAPAPAANCAAVTPSSLSSYARTIERALKSAQKDARANGTDGQYAVAATNARDLLQRSMERIEDGATKLQNADPRTTTYAEGGMIKEHVRSTLEWMPQAAHWALISAIYHKSTDARDAFEGTVTAMAEGQQLFAESGRCYLSGYLQ